MVPEGIEKIDRSKFLTFLDTTPTATNPTWAILGTGITDYAIDFNPQVDTEKWIIEDTARSDHTSNQKQGNVSQKMYKNDPCFEFAHNGIDKLNYKTHILDIERWNGNNGTYPAKLSDGLLIISSYMGENAVIEYELHYEGDAVEGSVTFTGNTPTFTPTISL